MNLTLLCKAIFIIIVVTYMVGVTIFIGLITTNYLPLNFTDR